MAVSMLLGIDAPQNMFSIPSPCSLVRTVAKHAVGMASLRSLSCNLYNLHNADVHGLTTCLLPSTESFSRVRVARRPYGSSY